MLSDLTAKLVLQSFILLSEELHIPFPLGYKQLLLSQLQFPLRLLVSPRSVQPLPSLVSYFGLGYQSTWERQGTRVSHKQALSKFVEACLSTTPLPEV